MKALVVTNCATAAYTSGLRALFPDWEVKGADLSLAHKWLVDEPNATFQEFLTAARLLVLPAADEPLFQEHLAGKEVLVIPYFHFRAFHPDSFHLGCGDRPVPSVLVSGNLHSRIAVTAKVLGMTENDAIAAFSARIYERIGYYSVFESEKSELLERFFAQGIDIEPDFENWLRSGNFLYTYNHAKAFVFNDILLRGLYGRFIDKSQMGAAHAALARVPDYLEPAIRWPVYPEIARNYGFESELVWRTGVDAGPKSLSLNEFIALSFETLARYPELDAGCIPGFEECRAALLQV